MPNDFFSQIALIVGALTVAITSVIGALASLKGNKMVADNSAKNKATAERTHTQLTEIHSLTNGTLTLANKRIDDLESLVRQILAAQVGAVPKTQLEISEILRDNKIGGQE